MRAKVRRKVTVPDGATLVAQRLYHNTKTRWQIWLYLSLGDWRNIKLVAVTDEKRRKHSFYLAWNVEKQRFARGDKYKMMEEYEPHVLSWAKRMCEEKLE